MVILDATITRVLVRGQKSRCRYPTGTPFRGPTARRDAGILAAARVLLAAILDAHPSCRGILFDLPDAVSEVIPHPRAQRVGGSFFESVPPGADAYLLKTVIHDFPDPQATAILMNIRKVIQPGGRLALVERVVTDSPDSMVAK
jgi:hypothetical protein